MMMNLENTDQTTRTSGTALEFMRIYGITLVVAAVLMCAYKWQANEKAGAFLAPTSVEVLEEQPASVPVADVKKLVGIDKAKSLFRNIFF